MNRYQRYRNKNRKPCQGGPDRVPCKYLSQPNKDDCKVHDPEFDYLGKLRANVSKAGKANAQKFKDMEAKGLVTYSRLKKIRNMIMNEAGKVATRNGKRGPFKTPVKNRERHKKWLVEKQKAEGRIPCEGGVKKPCSNWSKPHTKLCGMHSGKKRVQYSPRVFVPIPKDLLKKEVDSQNDYQLELAKQLQKRGIKRGIPSV